MLSLLCIVCYKVYIKLHRLVMTCLIILLWQHLSILSFFSQFYIIIMVGIFMSMIFLHFLQILFWYAIYSSFHSSTQIIRISTWNNIYYFKIQMFRSWTVYTGQYFFIWILFCSFWSLFQSHSFIIVWWNEKKNGSIAQIYIIV